MANERLGDIAPGSTGKSMFVELRSTVNNLWASGVLANAVSVKIIRLGEAIDSSLVITDLASVVDPHTPGGWIQLEPGLFRLDMKDSAWAVGAEGVVIRVEASGTYGYQERFRLGSAYLSSAERVLIAQAVLNADMGNGRLFYEALAILRNRVTIDDVSGNRIVYFTDDLTPMWESTVQVDGARSPIKSFDPTT